MVIELKVSKPSTPLQSSKTSMAGKEDVQKQGVWTKEQAQMQKDVAKEAAQMAKQREQRYEDCGLTYFD